MYEQEVFNMSKFTIIGGLLCLGGLLLIGFQAISSMMTAGDIAWQSLSIVDIVNAEYLKWIDGISWHGIQKIIKYIASMPLYILLFAVGAATLVVGGITDK